MRSKGRAARLGTTPLPLVGQASPSPSFPPQANCIAPPAFAPLIFDPARGNLPSPRLLLPSETPIRIVATPTASPTEKTIPCTGVEATAYPPGWSLVAGYSGTDILYSDGPLYTLRPGDGAYEGVPTESAQGVTWTPLQPGIGYWVYFDQTTDVRFSPPPPSHQPLSSPMPAGQYIMIGNPFDTPAAVTGVDITYTYEQDVGYTATTTLQGGEGAFAYSASGGTVTLVPTSP